MAGMKRLFAVGVLAFALAACANGTATPSSQVTRVVSTTSFGMCVGYCTTRLEISEGQAVLIRQARGGRGAPQNLPEQRYTTQLTLAQWQEVQRLAAATDLTAVPPVVGCPDCADGGAEELTVESAGAAESVSLEHGASLPQAQPLLDRVRALRSQLMPAE